MTDTTLPPALVRSQRDAPDDDDDELPPWLGQRMRDTTYHIHRAADKATLDSKDATP